MWRLRTLQPLEVLHILRAVLQPCELTLLHVALKIRVAVLVAAKMQPIAVLDDGIGSTATSDLRQRIRGGSDLDNLVHSPKDMEFGPKRLVDPNLASAKADAAVDGIVDVHRTLDAADHNSAALHPLDV
eukprot:SAG31_NODE_512_length_14721_cov_17.995623_15_plen_129_part_00